MKIVPQTKSLAQRSLQDRHAAIGYALYQAGQPVTACQNADQRRGWMSALRDEADAETAAYLSMAVR